MCHAVIAFPSDSIRLIKCLKKIIIINCEYYIFWLKVITHKHEFVTCSSENFTDRNNVLNFTAKLELSDILKISTTKNFRKKMLISC